MEQARERYDALQAELAGLPLEEMVEAGIVGEWSVKDVLAHLTAWQQMTHAWYQAGKRGETPITPSEKYTWREIPALNQEIYENHRDRPLDEVKREFVASHRETLDLIETTTDDELFTPKVYAWTKSTTLGSYLTSATSSHYEWARKEIRRGFKAKRKQQGR
jgi:hypothetical protein